MYCTVHIRKFLSLESTSPPSSPLQTDALAAALVVHVLLLLLQEEGEESDTLLKGMRTSGVGGGGSNAYSQVASNKKPKQKNKKQDKTFKEKSNVVRIVRYKSRRNLIRCTAVY